MSEVTRADIDITALQAAYDRALGGLYDTYLAETRDSRADVEGAKDKFRVGLMRHRAALKTLSEIALETDA